MEPLNAISPIDGRYRPKTEKLAAYFSERAMILQRTRIELEYLRALATKIGRSLSATQTELTTQIFRTLIENDAEIYFIKSIDEKIRHDSKAIEYYLRDKFKNTELEPYSELLHFGLTSADIDNLATIVSLRDFVSEILLPDITTVKEVLARTAENWKQIPMLARTHGQPAVPTTLGKESANFALRVHHQELGLRNAKFYGKLNGAVGNFNAHTAAFPEIDWVAFSEEFVISLKLEPLAITTQVPPYDNLVSLLDRIRLLNSILTGLCQDIWRYISDDYFVLKPNPEEVGSSTMPQKVNPIDFEMAESNFSSANALLENMARRLPINRLQRDLTDKYLLRDLGPAMAYTHVGIEAVLAGLGKIYPNTERLNQDLELRSEIIAEGIQTILRAAGIPDAYEKLKELTRGKKITKDEINQFIEELGVPEEIKTKLRALSPATYIGKAIELTEKALEEIRGRSA